MMLSRWCVTLEQGTEVKTTRTIQLFAATKEQAMREAESWFDDDPTVYAIDALKIY